MGESAERSGADGAKDLHINSHRSLNLSIITISDPPIHIDDKLVERLIADQFPEWAGLPISRVEPGGWDNRTFRLGANLSVRLPSAERYAAQVMKEHRWLPILARHLPLAIPEPLAIGQPADAYPWHWSVYRWIEGETAATERIDDMSLFATTLARFLRSLQQTDASEGPLPGAHNFQRGGPPAFYDAETREAITSLRGGIDTETATAAWEKGLESTWDRSPVWLHGDVSASNLLVRHGVLSAVIDFGSAGVGDPACDLAIAWTFFSGESREAFRDALAPDKGMWERGRGWALWKALITLAEHRKTDLQKAVEAGRVIDEILGDFRKED